ncbi:MAG: bacteriorhodopsin, partial [Paracoccaceae bacterium]
GYPGEVATTAGARWFWGIASMIPFLWIIYELFVGLSSSIKDQPEDARGLVSVARYLVIGSWAFYPVVYFAGAVGLDGGTATVVIEVGYTIADITAKAVFGVLIFMIAQRKSAEYFARQNTVVQPAE